MKNHTQSRVASIKETGEELSQEEWERFDIAVAQIRTQRDIQKARGDVPQAHVVVVPAGPVER